MKRSEIVDKIQLLLETQSRHGCSYRFKALEIVELIEEAGMLPPYRDVLIEGHQCDENSWEPEDA
jgi:hypothetical protein